MSKTGARSRRSNTHWCILPKWPKKVVKGFTRWRRLTKKLALLSALVDDRGFFFNQKFNNFFFYVCKV